MVGWRILLWAVLVLAALIFLYLVRAILLPFVVGSILAALLEPLVRGLRMRGMPRTSAVVLVMAVFAGAAVGATVLLAPTVVTQISSLTSDVQAFTKNITEPGESDNFFLSWNPLAEAQKVGTTNDQVDRLLDQYGSTLARFGIPSTRQGLIHRFIEPNRGEIVKFFEGSIHSFFGFLTNLPSQLVFVFLTPLVTMLLLLDMENFKRRSPRFIPPQIRVATMQVLDDIGQVFFKYLRGISTVVLLYSASQIVMMLIMRVPYAFLLGLLFGALYLIPYIGNLLSATIVLMVVGLGKVSGNMIFNMGSIGGLPPEWSYALLVTGLYLVIGLSFDHLIYPQMIGNSVGLSPVVSLFVIFCGDALFGLPGMIIAFPLAGSVKVILDRLLRVTSTSQDSLNLPSIPLRHRTT